MSQAEHAKEKLSDFGKNFIDDEVGNYIDVLIQSLNTSDTVGYLQHLSRPINIPSANNRPSMGGLTFTPIRWIRHINQSK